MVITRKYILLKVCNSSDVYEGRDSSEYLDTL